MGGEAKVRETWVEVPPGSDFTIHNLPYGVFRSEGREPRVGVALGDQVVDLAALADQGLLPGLDPQVFRQPRLNGFIALGAPAWAAVRGQLQALLGPQVGDRREPVAACLVPRSGATMLLPVEVGDFVDFYSSREHATNTGTMFRGPANALGANWKHLPIGYHGRSSSLVVSGTDVRRPSGQTRPDPDAPPRFGPCRALDFELEMGLVVGRASGLGTPVPVERAEEHIFGLVLVNDWSARDIQKWEYVPLGPFLGKSFATSVSPWVVPLAALEPFRTRGPEQDVEVLPYLRADGPRTFDIALEVLLQSPRMAEPVRICRSNFRHLYWSMAQQIAHLTSNGTNMRVGDLYASGTISGPERDQRGSMLEISWNGTEPLALPDGTTRTFLEDGDTLIMRAFAETERIRVGFGEVRGSVLPAL